MDEESLSAMTILEVGSAIDVHRHVNAVVTQRPASRQEAE
jgi:hypothetical protein